MNARGTITQGFRVMIYCLLGIINGHCDSGYGIVMHVTICCKNK